MGRIQHRHYIAPPRAAQGTGPSHGAISTYGRFGCRCDECREAKRRYRLDEHAAARAKKSAAAATAGAAGVVY